MDGPNVNQKFLKLFSEQFSENYGTEFLDISTFSLYQVHNSFRKGIQAFDFDIDGFVTDVCVFFKHLAAI